ncbi:MAG: hypothetical protein SO072_10990 [Dysosmobacter sp.]|nr:hypothetical protein [Dysosmobacter sp.]
MTVSFTFNGKPFGNIITGLKEDDLLDLIKAELELGRSVHITPDENDIIKKTRHDK